MLREKGTATYLALSNLLRYLVNVVPIRLEELKLYELAYSDWDIIYMVARDIDLLQLVQIPKVIREVFNRVETKV